MIPCPVDLHSMNRQGWLQLACFPWTMLLNHIICIFMKTKVLYRNWSSLMQNSSSFHMHYWSPQSQLNCHVDLFDYPSRFIKEMWPEMILFISSPHSYRHQLFMTIVWPGSHFKKKVQTQSDVKLFLIIRWRAVISVWFQMNIKKRWKVFLQACTRPFSSLAKRRSLFMWSEWHSHPALCMIHWRQHNMTGLVSRNLEK